jgi:hypothetical protein
MSYPQGYYSSGVIQKGLARQAMGRAIASRHDESDAARGSRWRRNVYHRYLDRGLLNKTIR